MKAKREFWVLTAIAVVVVLGFGIAGVIVEGGL